MTEPERTVAITDELTAVERSAQLFRAVLFTIAGAWYASWVLDALEHQGPSPTTAHVVRAAVASIAVLAVSVALLLAAYGLLRRRLWGEALAVGLSVNGSIWLLLTETTGRWVPVLLLVTLGLAALVSLLTMARVRPLKGRSRDAVIANATLLGSPWLLFLSTAEQPLNSPPDGQTHVLTCASLAVFSLVLAGGLRGARGWPRSVPLPMILGALASLALAASLFAAAASDSQPSLAVLAAMCGLAAGAGCFPLVCAVLAARRAEGHEEKPEEDESAVRLRHAMARSSWSHIGLTAVLGCSLLGILGHGTGPRDSVQSARSEAERARRLSTLRYEALRDEQRRADRRTRRLERELAAYHPMPLLARALLTRSPLRPGDREELTAGIEARSPTERALSARTVTLLGRFDWTEGLSGSLEQGDVAATGLRLSHVDDGSIASLLGFRTNDVVTSIGDLALTDENSLLQGLTLLGEVSRASVSVRRNDEPVELVYELER